MSIYNYFDYRKFLKEFLLLQPKRGHGILSQWAKALGVSTTLVSQILLEKKSLSLEMADDLARYLKLTKQETDYFILLVEFDRAGTKSLKDYFHQKVKEAQQQARFLKNRIQNVSELSSEARATYYSNWAYSGLTNLIACSQTETVEAVSSRLKLPRQSIVEILEFLVQHGILVETKKGWKIGPQNTYISSDSPLVQKHHQNWRLRAIHTMDERSTEDLFYTSPMSLSDELAKKIRTKIIEFITEVQGQVGPSPSEIVRCLNIDFFQF